jgi:hypothetical protein
MAYEITLTDSVDTMTISFPRPPLEERDIEGAVDVTTLDMNVYTDFFAKKREWSNTLQYMSEADFNKLKGFYDRQFTLWQYPLVSIPDLGVSNIVVRMSLSPRQVIDNCGTVQNVQITLRETVQQTIDWGSS